MGIKKKDIPKSVQNAILDDVANYVLESTLSDVGGLTSPVTGRRFKDLSPAYKERKKKEGGTPIPNLELDGDMLNGLNVKRSGSKLKTTVPASEQKKADGHNNFSGDSALPERNFIPDAARGQTYRAEIRKGIKEIIRDRLEDEGLL